jgi:hypothetical protein
MPAKYKSCIRKVAAKKGTKSAHAICTAKDAGGIQAYRKQEKRRGR